MPNPFQNSRIYLRGRAHVFDLDPTQLGIEDIAWIFGPDGSPSGEWPPTVKDMWKCGTGGGYGIMKIHKDRRGISVPRDLAWGKPSVDKDKARFQTLIDHLKKEVSKVLVGCSPYLLQNIRWNVYLPAWMGTRVHFKGVEYLEQDWERMAEHQFSATPQDHDLP